MKKHKILDENDVCASARLVRMVKCARKLICSQASSSVVASTSAALARQAKGLLSVAVPLGALYHCP